MYLREKEKQYTEEECLICVHKALKTQSPPPSCFPLSPSLLIIYNQTMKIRFSSLSLAKEWLSPHNLSSLLKLEGGDKVIFFKGEGL